MAEIRERTIDVGGTAVLVREADPLTPVPTLYLHGVPVNGRDWVPFLERTGGIAPDLPGFGRSDKSAAFDYSIPGYTQFLRALIDELGLERFALAVHDWGGVGLALAQEQPERTERLVIADAVPLVPGYRWHPIARIWRTPVLGELFQGSTARWSVRFLMRRIGALPDHAIPEFADAMLEHFDQGTQRAILRLYRSAPPDVLARAGERLGEVRAPALVVWGEKDPFLPTSFAHAMANALGGEAEVRIVPGGRHWPWLDDPGVIDEVARFLGTDAGG